MKLTLLAVGKLKAGPDREIYQRYAERIGPAGKGVRIGPFELQEFGESRHKNPTQRREEEARQVLGTIDKDSHVVCLDEKGRSISSEGFASLLSARRDDGVKSLTFVIGGPDGHGDELKQRADTMLSLGAMTLPHGLVRIVLAEQIYRALTILTGHPYHRG